MREGYGSLFVCVCVCVCLSVTTLAVVSNPDPSHFRSAGCIASGTDKEIFHGGEWVAVYSYYTKLWGWLARPIPIVLCTNEQVKGGWQ